MKNPFAYLKIVFEFISYFLSFENMSNNITSHTYLGTPYTFYATVLGLGDYADQDIVAVPYASYDTKVKTICSKIATL